MTATSLLLPAPVLGANVLKKVSEVQVSDSAGDPAKDEIREEAKISMLALSMVIDAVFVEISNFQIPNESGVRRSFKEVDAPCKPSVGQLF